MMISASWTMQPTTDIRRGDANNVRLCPPPDSAILACSEFWTVTSPVFGRHYAMFLFVIGLYGTRQHTDIMVANGSLHTLI